MRTDLSRRRKSLALLVGLTAVALSGCAGVSDEPVPTVAKAPFACAGVPITGVQLMSGEDDLEADHDQGSWADPQNGLVCSLKSGDDTVVSVSLSTVASTTGSSDFAQRLERSKTAPNAAEIIADEQGEGYVHESDGFVEARWVCGQAYLAVDLHTTAPKRDALKDVSRYVISMLPWACGGEDPPKKSEEG